MKDGEERRKDDEWGRREERKIKTEVKTGGKKNE